MEWTTRPGRAHARIVLILGGLTLLTGLALRLALVLTVDRPETPYAENDEAVYYRIAANLVEGHGFSASLQPPYEPTALRTPGWPLLLAAGFLPAGPSVRSGLVLAALADLLTALALWSLVARATRSPLAGLLACAGWCFLSPFLPLLEFLYPDPAGALLVCLAVGCAWVVLDAPRSPARRAITAAGFGTGALWGAAVLTRPFLLPSALAGVCLLPRRRLWQAGLGLALILVPWTARNALQLERFVPLSYGGAGINLWVGTWNTSGPVMVLRADAEGKLHAVFPGDWAGSPEERRRTTLLWNTYMEAFLTDGGPELARHDAAFRSLALERIRRDPRHWLQLRGRNLWEVWTLPQVPGGRWMGGALLLAAAAGALSLLRQRRFRAVLLLAVPVLVLAAALAPLRSLPRYAATVAPLLFALAACALPGSPHRHGETDATGSEQ